MPGEQPSKRGGHHDKRGEPDAVFEIHVADAEEGERLAQQQAKVFYEVFEWYARQHQPQDSPEGTSTDT